MLEGEYTSIEILDELKNRKRYTNYRTAYYMLLMMLRDEYDRRIIGIKGLRHIGKTTVMKQLCAKLNGSVFFDAAAFVRSGNRCSTGELKVRLFECVKDADRKYIFIDEVNTLQEIGIDVKSVIEYLYDCNVRVVITSSSTIYLDMLLNGGQSRENRYVGIAGYTRMKLFMMGEMSFQEYLRFNNKLGWDKYYIGESLDELKK